MKKIIILLIAAMMFSGCTAGIQQEVQKEQDNENSQTIEGNEQTTADEEVTETLENILINGIITEINEGMVTVEVLEGDVNPVIVIKISDETQMAVPMDLMKVGQYISAEISPAMTRSLPPQSNAIKILALNDVVLGEVADINAEQITLKPVNFFNHEIIVITLSEQTIWDVDKDSVSAGHSIRVVIGMQMTLSIPPITQGVRVLSIETHD